MKRRLQSCMCNIFNKSSFPILTRYLNILTSFTRTYWYCNLKFSNSQLKAHTRRVARRSKTKPLVGLCSYLGKAFLYLQINKTYILYYPRTSCQLPYIHNIDYFTLPYSYLHISHHHYCILYHTTPHHTTIFLHLHISECAA